MKHPDNFQYIPRKGNGYVYHIQSSDKHYIGISTTPFSVRWDRHKAPWSGCTKLVRELKHLKDTGQWNTLKVQILQQAQNKYLDRLQKKYIRKYGTYNSLRGLNSTPGGRQVTPASMHKKYKSKRYKKRLKHKIKNFTWNQVLPLEVFGLQSELPNC